MKILKILIFFIGLMQVYKLIMKTDLMGKFIEPKFTNMDCVDVGEDEKGFIASTKYGIYTVKLYVPPATNSYYDSGYVYGVETYSIYVGNSQFKKIDCPNGSLREGPGGL